MTKSELKQLIREVIDEMDNDNLNETDHLGAFLGGAAGGLLFPRDRDDGGMGLRDVIGNFLYNIKQKRLYGQQSELVAKYFEVVITPIVKRFANDSQLKSMYDALPPYPKAFAVGRSMTRQELDSVSVRNKGLKKIADYVKSHLSSDEKIFFPDVSVLLRGKSPVATSSTIGRARIAQKRGLI